MICTECKVRNPLGNKFCRECGAKLASPTEGSLAAEEMARIAQERAAEKSAVLLTSALDLSEKNLHEEAIPLALQAASLMPESTTAHSLLATLYERTGQNAQAIEEMERVVALNPQSAADAEKLDQLRRGVHILPRRIPAGSRLPHAEAMGEPKSNTYIPFALAGAVTVGVLVLGFAVMNRPERVRTVTRPVASAPMSPGQVSAAPVNSSSVITAVPNGSAPNTLVKPQAGWVAPPIPGGARPDPFASLGSPDGSTGAAKPMTGAARLPRPAFSAPERPLGVAPVMLPGIGATVSPSAGATGSPSRTLPPILAAPPRQGAPGFGAGARIPAGPPASGETPASSASSGGGDGYIRITVGPPGGTGGSAGSGTGSTGGNGANGGVVIPPAAPRPDTPGGNPMAVARRLQREGKYREAINAYREGLNNGAGGDAYQGIAQCYKSLGDDGAARGAYRDALRAYEAQAASGRGSGVAQRGIASCKAALDLLGA